MTIRSNLISWIVSKNQEKPEITKQKHGLSSNLESTFFSMTTPEFLLNEPSIKNWPQVRCILANKTPVPFLN